MNTLELSFFLESYEDQFSDIVALTNFLNDQSIELRDEGRKLMGDIKDVIGKDATRRLLGSMDAAGASDPLVKHAAGQLAGQGLDLTDEDVRTALDGMASMAELPMTQADADAVKAIGVWHMSLFEMEAGKGQSVSESEVQVAADMHSLRKWVQEQSAAVETGIHDGTVTTQSEAIAIFSS